MNKIPPCNKLQCQTIEQQKEGERVYVKNPFSSFYLCGECVWYMLCVYNIYEYVCMYMLYM